MVGPPSTVVSPLISCRYRSERYSSVACLSMGHPCMGHALLCPEWPRRVLFLTIVDSMTIWYAMSVFLIAICCWCLPTDVRYGSFSRSSRCLCDLSWRFVHFTITRAPFLVLHLYYLATYCRFRHKWCLQWRMTSLCVVVCPTIPILYRWTRPSLLDDVTEGNP